MSKIQNDNCQLDGEHIGGGNHDGCYSPFLTDKAAGSGCYVKIL